MKLQILLKAGLYKAKWDIFAALIATLAIGALFLGLALTVNWIVDSLLIDQKILSQVALLIVGGMVIYGLIESFRQIALYRIKTQLILAQQTKLYQYLMSLPLSFYRDHDSADLAQTAYQLNSTLTLRYLQLLTTMIEMLPIFLALCLWLPGVVLITLLGISSVMFWWIPKLYTDSWQLTQSSKLFYTLTRNIIQGIAKLRISGATEPVLRYWEQMHHQYQKKLQHLKRRQDLISLLLSLLPFVLVSLWIKPEVGISLSLWLYFRNLAKCLGDVADFSSDWGKYSDFLAKIEWETTIQNPIVTTLTGAIEVENVVFRYEASCDPVLKGLSLQISAGQRIAIVGVSGAGKSTLLRILAGIDQPESGIIRYDGHELKQIKDFQRQIGVVLQDSKISAGSLWSNINGFTQYPIELAWAAAKKAAIDEFIEGLIMNMHTLVDEYASILSRGQAQRVLLARALVHQPHILFLDEATNAIDGDTQAKIFQNLTSYTIIIVAQRLSTLQFADVIYVLHEGSIAEQGSYTTLIEQNGLFAQLIQDQLI